MRRRVIERRNELLCLADGCGCIAWLRWLLLGDAWIQKDQISFLSKSNEYIKAFTMNLKGHYSVYIRCAIT